MAILASFSIFDACGMAAVSLRPLLFAVIDAAVPISFLILRLRPVAEWLVLGSSSRSHAIT